MTPNLSDPLPRKSVIILAVPVSIGVVFALIGTWLGFTEGPLNLGVASLIIAFLFIGEGITVARGMFWSTLTLTVFFAIVLFYMKLNVPM